MVQEASPTAVCRKDGTRRNIPELLAPAGNRGKLALAIHYGADAVYLGGKAFGLRNQADNFSDDELEEAVAFAHERGVKAYLTVNWYANGADLPGVQTFLERIAAVPFDALIVADPGVFDLIREISPERPIHLSTQANTTNWRSVAFWSRQGVSRINLAREMSLEEIGEVKRRVPVEIEVFAHGALCISYSGRCLLSSAMTGRNANKGECAHPCRWNYSLVEETRPGEYYPVVEDDHGTFIFNSRDLCLLPYLPELITAGVDSLKIEGRMKGVNYVASVVRVYREALDRYHDDPERYSCRPEWLEELAKISHRGYTTGFIFGEPRDVGVEYDSRYLRSHDFVGVVAEAGDSDGGGEIAVDVRNRIRRGDHLEFIGPGMVTHSLLLEKMTDCTGQHLDTAHPNSRIMLNVPFPTARLDLVRRERLPEMTRSEAMPDIDAPLSAPPEVV
jgi:putative protease